MITDASLTPGALLERMHALRAMLLARKVQNVKRLLGHCAYLVRKQCQETPCGAPAGNTHRSL